MNTNNHMENTTPDDLGGGILTTLGYYMSVIEKVGILIVIVFDTKGDKLKFCEDQEKEEFYVVWSGTQTGVMEEDGVLTVMCGVEPVVIEGPIVVAKEKTILVGAGTGTGEGTEEVSERGRTDKDTGCSDSDTERKSPSAVTTPTRYGGSGDVKGDLGKCRRRSG